jgi:hypothetical protein
MGNLSSPITGVGSCVNNNGVASKAMTQNGSATVEGGAPLELPQTINLPTPKTPALTPFSTPVGLGSGTVANACLYLNGYTTPFPVGATPLPGCSVSGNTVTLSSPPVGPLGQPLTLPPLTLSDSVNVVLTATPGLPGTVTSAEYDFSSITLTGQSSLAVNTDAPTHSVAAYLTGKNSNNTDIPTVMDFQGGAAASDATFGAVQGCQACSPYDASLLGFYYGGTGAISMVGNSSAAATVYAPNADATFGGTSDLYGSVVAKTLTIDGGGGGANGISVNFDQSLSGTGVTAGAPMLASFSWKKY